MYSVSAKIVKPPGEKPDEFEATISQVSSEVLCIGSRTTDKCQCGKSPIGILETAY